MQTVTYINEFLQWVYQYIPKDLLIIIMAGLTVGLWETYRQHKREKWQSHKRKN